jgi:hypothetical protein
MLRILRNKSLWALAIPLVVCGSAYAGGAHCNHGGQVAAAHDDADNGSHCNLSKNVTKSSKMTKDGAVVTLVGKTDEAVAHIKEHLTTHEKGGDCPDCPFTMDGVSASFKITDKGGEVTLTGANPEAVKKVQEWARKPAGDCCGKAKSA